MQFRIHPLEVQLAVAALGAVAGLLALAMRLAPARLAGPRAERALDAALAALAAVGGLGFFVLSAHPQQFVKTWDVQHAYFGAKYARELGYFRIYQCILALDAPAAGFFQGIEAASDLRRPMATLPRAELLRDSDCERRFDPERRRRFLADLAFFQELGQQPDRRLWFADNGYNQTPFFTALLRPLFERLPLRYGTLLGLALVDPALIALSLLAAWRAFGARAALVAATFFFTEVPNQWNVMGGGILRFGYVSLAVLGACALARGRARAAGAAFGGAALLQLFPALYPAALVGWATLRRLRGERPPAWLAGLAGSFAATVGLGLLLSAAALGFGAWPEFLAKIALHGQILSLYRIGFKCLLLVDHFLAPAPDYDYAAAVRALPGRLPLHLAGAALLAAATLPLARKVGALAFAATVLAVSLYLLTPVHYYFSVLVLLLLVERAELRGPAHALIWAALFAWSAAGYASLLATGSRAFTNAAVLSPGLCAVLAVHLAALYAERGSRAGVDRRRGGPRDT
jgi:hypothetical protein